MRTALRLFSVLLLAVPSCAALISAPAGVPASVGASAAVGAVLGSPFASAASGISLRSTALTLSSLDALRTQAPAIADPRQRLAAVALLGALTLPPAALPQRLSELGVPKPAADRVVKIAQRLDAAAAKDPAVAAQVAAGRKADQAFVESVAAAPEKVLPPDLLSTFRAFMDWGRAAAGLPSAPQAPVVGADAPDRGRTGADPVVPVDPKTRPQVAFGSVSLPVVAQPTLGDDISALWTSAHGQSRAAIVAMYNFDDMDMAKSIVAAAKKGQKQIIVGDYSNWFPQRMQTAIDEAKKTGKPLPSQTPAMQYLIANLGPDLELYILKGLGSIGINHNKFTVFTGADGRELLQGGSFNYTKTSQLHHWENVVFSDDADRLAYYKTFHAWLVRRARKYSPDLAPADPVMDPKDPIPLDPSRAIAFHGVPFPKVSGSPNGGTEDWLVRAQSLVTKTLDILMFSPFPTPKMAAALEALLAKKIPVRLIADRSEASLAGAVLQPLLDKGLQMKTIEGPDVVIDHQPWSQSSKMHEKVMVFDGGTPAAFAKMGDSLNISNNALVHNFENTQFWQGFNAAFMQVHFDLLWSLAQAPTAELLAKFKAEYDKWRQSPAAGKA